MIILNMEIPADDPDQIDQWPGKRPYPPIGEKPAWIQDGIPHEGDERHGKPKTSCLFGQRPGKSHCSSSFNSMRGMTTLRRVGDSWISTSGLPSSLYLLTRSSSASSWSNPSPVTGIGWRVLAKTRLRNAGQVPPTSLIVRKTNNNKSNKQKTNQKMIFSSTISRLMGAIFML